MIKYLNYPALLIALVVLSGCKGSQHATVPVVLQAEKSDRVTMQIPGGYIEEPKKPEGVLSNVLLRIGAKEFSGTAFVPESEVRMLMEPRSGKTDAGHSRQSSALIRVKWGEEAIVKSAEKSKKGLIAYSYPNSQEPLESYFLKSSTGDVFVECKKSVCSAYKTWSKHVHLRIDFQPVNAADIALVDTAIDGMLKSFEPETEAVK